MAKRNAHWRGNWSRSNRLYFSLCINLTLSFAVLVAVSYCKHRLRTYWGNSLSSRINICFEHFIWGRKNTCQEKVAGFIFTLSSLLTDSIQILFFYLVVIGNCMFSYILGHKFLGIIAHFGGWLLLLCGIVEFCNKFVLRISVFSVCPSWKQMRYLFI